ncbi:trypco2 family protein [Nostocoides sp. F2B08]|uniref:trypco2 family protein n=1 Tax=Nostocoides sp. F2B08 TaxID=2653936 RepID=UPI00351A8922
MTAPRLSRSISSHRMARSGRMTSGSGWSVRRLLGRSVMSEGRGSSGSGAAPWGAVSLSDAIASLREELSMAWASSSGEMLRFRPSPVELSLEVAVTSDKTEVPPEAWRHRQ